jgi:hypothetical protein
MFSRLPTTSKTGVQRTSNALKNKNFFLLVELLIEFFEHKPTQVKFTCSCGRRKILPAPHATARAAVFVMVFVPGQCSTLLLFFKYN